jgi:PIN domain nuclease of toxin-antitoxin system
LLECAIKIRIGKLEIDMDLSEMDNFLNQVSIRLIYFDAWASAEYVRLPVLAWADPFDTAVIAQAITKQMTLVTGDLNILESSISGLRTLNATK